MYIWILLLIAIFQLYNSAMADWDPLSALILVDTPFSTVKRFPSEVRNPETYGCVVYFERMLESFQRAYTYCPNPRRIPKCNYLVSSAGKNEIMANNRLIDECDDAVEYDMIPVTDSNGQHKICQHHNKIGYRYRFIYRLCEDGEIRTIRIYEMCYQDYWKQIILGSYTILNPNLLRNPLLRDEQRYSFELNIGPNHNNFFHRLMQLYQQNDDYRPRFVLPPELLPFANQRRTLFDFTNTAPMHWRLIDGWELLMINLKRMLSHMNYAIHVTAGLLDVGADEYLGTINGEPKIKISEFWWVLIYTNDYTEGVAIIMHNRLCIRDDNGRPNMSYYDPVRCSIYVHCLAANLINALPGIDLYSYNFIYCCEPQFITDNFGVGGLPNTKILRLPDIQI